MKKGIICLKLDEKCSNRNLLGQRDMTIKKEQSHFKRDVR